MFFLDALQGWVATDLGNIYRTTDGGVTWTFTYAPGGSGAQNWYNDIAFTDALHGVAVGNHGRIVRTVDGGLTWSIPASAIIPELNITELTDVHWLSATEVWILGSNGVMLRSVDQGDTWTLLDRRRVSGGAFAFQGPNVWVVGGCGMIVRTEIPDLITSVPQASPQEGSLPLYPNPSGGGMIHWPTSVPESTSVEVRILNMLGACVHTSSVKANASGLLNIPSGNLEPGSYIITATTSTATLSTRLQIAREQ